MVRLLNKDIAAEVFVELDSDLQEELINLSSNIIEFLINKKVIYFYITCITAVAGT